MIHFTFDEQKATDAANYLLCMNGGILPCSELLRRLYIADRISLSEYHYSITTDSYSSTVYGPVCTNIYECIKSYLSLPSSSTWKKAISIKGDEASLKEITNSFDMLSEEEKDILRLANESLLTDFPECKEPDSAITVEDIVNTMVKDKKERKQALKDLDLSSEIQRLNFRNRQKRKT